MENRLYVGSLSYDTKEDALKELFSQAGAVNSANIIMDKFSGRSKGFGFVEMASEEEAKKAIEMFNGKEVDGRKLVVDIARPMEKREGFKKPFGGFRSKFGSKSRGSESEENF
jgi:cold-inducible RNA-binding protein